MTGEATLKEVIGRLGKAIDALESAVAARLEQEQDYSEAEAEVQRMNADRARLATELDNSEAKSERLEEANKEVSRRLVTAMETIRAVLDREGDPMAQVTVTIDGKQYRMACDEGQEEHLLDLSRRFDRYVSHLKDSFGEIGDQRLTVMAGIMVMDELAELQKRVKGMESEIGTLRKTRDDALTKADKNDAALTGALAGLAQRMEDLAGKLVVRKP